MIKEYTEQLIKVLEEQKSEFVKSKFISKGYDLEAMSGGRFPKVSTVYHAGWTYYFADDGTTNGDFIVAVCDCKVEVVEHNKVIVSFDHQDKDYSPVKLFIHTAEPACKPVYFSKIINNDDKREQEGEDRSIPKGVADGFRDDRGRV
jgi:hypothetical protein